MPGSDATRLTCRLCPGFVKACFRLVVSGLAKRDRRRMNKQPVTNLPSPCPASHSGRENQFAHFIRTPRNRESGKMLCLGLCTADHSAQKYVCATFSRMFVHPYLGGFCFVGVSIPLLGSVAPGDMAHVRTGGLAGPEAGAGRAPHARRQRQHEGLRGEGPPVLV